MSGPTYTMGAASTAVITAQLWEVLADMDAEILQSWCGMWIPNAHVEITALRLVEE